MSDSDTFTQLLEHAKFNTVRWDHFRQLELQRYWDNELEKTRNADPKRLLRYGFKVYSQCDEDGIIQEIFRRVGVTDRSFVEFGVEIGVECNTVKLLVEGWHGLWIEASPQHAARIRSNFAALLGDSKLNLVEAFVFAENINALLERGGASGEIDLLSIDIDNNDYWVWKAITRINPRVVVVEYNATLRPPMSLVVPYQPERAWDGTNYFGASLEAFVRLGRSKGYRLVGCRVSGVNAFFVRDDIAGHHFFDPATAEELSEPPRYFFGMMRAGHPPMLGPYVSV
ncbi:MAG TPA: hypothetical protein VE396_07340 [Xanthobacteraceae bacterium]|nr:hypothetical protein [Xanthobacteraceae bacterium]